MGATIDLYSCAYYLTEWAICVLSALSPAAMMKIAGIHWIILIELIRILFFI